MARLPAPLPLPNTTWILESLNPDFTDMILPEEEFFLGRDIQPYAATISRKSVKLELQHNPAALMVTNEGSNPVVVKRKSDGVETRLTVGKPEKMEPYDLIRLQGFQVCYEYIFKPKEFSIGELEHRENALLLQLKQTQNLLSHATMDSPSTQKRKRKRDTEAQSLPTSPRKRQVTSSPRKGKRHYTAIVTNNQPMNGTFTFRERNSNKEMEMNQSQGLFPQNIQLWTVTSPKPNIECKETKYWFMSSIHNIDLITVENRVHFQFCAFDQCQLLTDPFVTDDIFPALVHWVLSSSMDEHLAKCTLTSIRDHFVSPKKTHFIKEQVLFIVNKLFSLCTQNEKSEFTFRYRPNKLPLVIHFLMAILPEFPHCKVSLSPQNRPFFDVITTNLQQNGNTKDLDFIMAHVECNFHEPIII